MTAFTRLVVFLLWLPLAAACTTAPAAESAPATKSLPTPVTSEQVDQKQADETAVTACPLTEPAWAKPPDDAAVQNEPEFGYYFVNEDRSMWASAWWNGQEDFPLRAGEDGNKVGWFRPAGETLEITGRRLDAQAPPLEAHIPCCYPTRFQATGLFFPAEGCWEVTARAAESQLSFVVWVEP